MTTIDRLWPEIEAEGGSAWRMRHARKDAAYALAVALEPQHASLVRLVPVQGLTLPTRREWPECRPLEWLTVSLDAISYWAVRLRDAMCADLFTALAQDIDARLALTKTTEQAAAELFGRLKLWQQFLGKWRNGMSLEARRRLWGELHFLHARSLTAMSAPAAIWRWKAGTAAHQAFQFLKGAAEVKTTSAKQPQGVRITSERQLDDTGVGALFLNVVIVDEREVGMEAGVPGQSLPALVAALRLELAGDPATLALFTENLFHLRWLDEHAPRYERRRLLLREGIVSRVEQGFTRLVKVHLQDGVGDVNYGISLTTCTPFQVEVGVMLATLTKISPPPQS
jgi:hypothetical protein